jgi:hypothetical protein
MMAGLARCRPGDAVAVRRRLAMKGIQLRLLARQLSGDDRPEQHVALLWVRTLVEGTALDWTGPLPERGRVA